MVAHVRFVRWILLSVAAVAAPLLPPSAQADEAFEGPKFRRGEWHFVRTPRGHDAGEGQDSPA